MSSLYILLVFPLSRFDDADNPVTNHDDNVVLGTVLWAFTDGGLRRGVNGSVFRGVVLDASAPCGPRLASTPTNYLISFTSLCPPGDTIG